MGSACSACCGQDEDIPSRSKHIEKQKIQMQSPGGMLANLESDTDERTRKQRMKDKLKKKDYLEDSRGALGEIDHVVIEKGSEEESSPPQVRHNTNHGQGQGGQHHSGQKQIVISKDLESCSPIGDKRKSHDNLDIQPIKATDHYLDQSFQDDVHKINQYTESGNLRMVQGKSVGPADMHIRERERRKFTKSFVGNRALNASQQKDEANDSLNNMGQRSFSKRSFHSRVSVKKRLVHVKSTSVLGNGQESNFSNYKQGLPGKKNSRNQMSGKKDTSKTESQLQLSAAAKSQYGYLLDDDPNKQFVLEIEDERVSDMEDYYYYGAEDDYGSELGDDIDKDIYQIEVDLGGGKKQKIAVNEEEYNLIFEEGRQDLLIEKVKQATKSKVVQALSSVNTVVNQKNGSANNSIAGA